MPFGPYDDFDACVRSNGDKDNPQAYCAEIKRQIEGESSLSESEQTALADSDCPSGHVRINDQCVPIEEVEDVPPSIMNAEPRQFTLAELEAEPITREELGDNKVKYSAVKVLQSGVWIDSGSRETIWYSPEGIENMELTEDNSVNLMHDDQNEVSEIGHMENLQAENGSLFADIVVDTSNAAGQYADENLQQTLESQGTKGFGGPSVEIPPEGQKIEFNESRGMKELKKGMVNGLGLVKNPASKPVSFAQQTAQRGVALSGVQNTMVLKAERDAMNLNYEAAKNALEEHGVDLDDKDDDEIQALADDLFESLQAEEDEDDPEESPPEGDEDDQPGGDEEDEGDDEEDDEEDEMDMGAEEVVETVQNLQERVSNLEDMAESMMQAEDVEEALEDTKGELADADTAQELSETIEGLEKRLSEIEEQPKKPKSLADDESEEDWANADSFTVGSSF